MFFFIYLLIYLFIYSHFLTLEFKWFYVHPISHTFIYLFIYIFAFLEPRALILYLHTISQTIFYLFIHSYFLLLQIWLFFLYTISQTIIFLYLFVFHDPRTLNDFLAYHIPTYYQKLLSRSRYSKHFFLWN